MTCFNDSALQCFAHLCSKTAEKLLSVKTSFSFVCGHMNQRDTFLSLSLSLSFQLLQKSTIQKRSFIQSSWQLISRGPNTKYCVCYSAYNILINAYSIVGVLLIKYFKIHIFKLNIIQSSGTSAGLIMTLRLILQMS